MCLDVGARVLTVFYKHFSTKHGTIKSKRVQTLFLVLWRTRFLLFLYKNNINRKLLFSGFSYDVGN